MKKCERCGANQLHKKFQCPAQKSKCFKCGSYGHFARQCRSRFKRSNCSIVSNDNDVAVVSSVQEMNYTSTDNTNLFQSFCY